MYATKFIILLAAIVTVGCKGFALPESDSNIPQATNITIADLHKLLNGKTLDITHDIIIGGYVTSSDEESNFYKSFCIEDATGGAEIMAGLYDLHNIYPEGCYVTISLNGCSVGEHYGVMQIGLKASEYDYYPTSYFATRAILDRHITRYDIFKHIPPLPTAISDLNTSSLCGSLVNIGHLRHASKEYQDVWEMNTDGCWLGYNIFADNDGNTIAIHTSDYADYAKHTIPDGTVAISGILQLGKIMGKEFFMIKMSHEKDCTPID